MRVAHENCVVLCRTGDIISVRAQAPVLLTITDRRVQGRSEVLTLCRGALHDPVEGNKRLRHELPETLKGRLRKTLGFPVMENVAHESKGLHCLHLIRASGRKAGAILVQQVIIAHHLVLYEYSEASVGCSSSRVVDGTQFVGAVRKDALFSVQTVGVVFAESRFEVREVTGVHHLLRSMII